MLLDIACWSAAFALTQFSTEGNQYGSVVSTTVKLTDTILCGVHRTAGKDSTNFPVSLGSTRIISNSVMVLSN